ncbi:MAG TPA: A24 family peptidase [Paenibacillaceae bacterium]
MTPETWFWTLFWFAAGSAAGSLCVTAGIRIPRKESLFRTPAVCPSCSGRWTAIDLVPIAGWIARGGKCRHCRAPIPPLRLMGEAVTGLLFSILYLNRSSLAEWVGGILLTLMLVTLSVSDLRYRLLPNRIVYPGFAAFVFYRLLLTPSSLWDNLFGLLMGGGLLLAVSWVSLWANRPAMGGGDIKLMAALGWLLGFELICLVVILSSFLGLAVGGSLIAAGKIRKDTFLPFGPFIAAAALFAWLWGRDVVDAYLNTLLIVL